MEHLIEKLKWFGQIVERLADEIRRLRAELADKTQQHDELNEKRDALKEENAQLRDELLERSDELRQVKNLPRRPKIKPSKPSGLHPKPESDTVPVGKRKPRRYSDKAERKTIIVEATDVPEGSRRDGCKTYTIQDLIVRPVVIEYRRECWRTPDGKRIVVPVPPHVHGQYGANEAVKVFKYSMIYQHLYL